MTDSMLLLPSIDDYLGPGENRFFSRGYQRAGYRVRDINIGPSRESGPNVSAHADVQYPADWSSKGGIDQRPHLSTVDALVLGVQLVEFHLAHEFSLSPSDRARTRMRRTMVRAGGAPQEDLAGVPLSARLVKSGIVSGARPNFLSVYDCTVGNLRVRHEVEHPIATGTAAGARYDEPDQLLGPGGQRYYGEGFKTRRHHIHGVRVDMGALTARADVHFTPEPGAAAQGIDGAQQPSVTFVDAFVINLQLVQVLLYELDSLSRASSNTLWMMQTLLETPAAAPPLPEGPDRAMPAEASLTNKRLLPLRGGLWRSVDVRASLAGISLRCSFAHELPAGAGAGD